MSVARLIRRKGSLNLRSRTSWSNPNAEEPREMIQKIALLIGGLGAAAVLAFALGLVNFAFADPTSNAVPEAQAAPADVAAAPAADSQNAQAQTNTQTKTVY